MSTQWTSTRPTGEVRVYGVEGGMWQAACVCRWQSRRTYTQRAAYYEAAQHKVNCGLCVREGRGKPMDLCSCANCTRRRVFRREHPLPSPDGCPDPPDPP